VDRRTSQKPRRKTAAVFISLRKPPAQAVFLPEAASVFAKTSSRQQTRRLLTAGLVLLLLLLLLLLLPFERTCTRTQEAD